MADVDFSVDSQTLREEIERLKVEVEGLTVKRDKLLAQVEAAEDRHRQSVAKVEAHTVDRILEMNGGSAEAAQLSTFSGKQVNSRGERNIQQMQDKNLELQILEKDARVSVKHAERSRDKWILKAKNARERRDALREQLRNVPDEEKNVGAVARTEQLAKLRSKLLEKKSELRSTREQSIEMERAARSEIEGIQSRLINLSKKTDDCEEEIRSMNRTEVSRERKLERIKAEYEEAKAGIEPFLESDELHQVVFQNHDLTFARKLDVTAVHNALKELESIYRPLGRSFSVGSFEDTKSTVQKIDRSVNEEAENDRSDSNAEGRKQEEWLIDFAQFNAVVVSNFNN